MSPAKVEQRLAAMEEELARLKSRVDGLASTKPWWEQIAGTFQGDPVYAEAMKLGQQYRRSQRPKPKPSKKK